MASQAAAWTPADLTDVLYWWYTDAGVTTSGGGVTAWTDQITSRTLSVNVGTPMTYTAADVQFNNLPSIYNDGTMATLFNGALTGDIANGDDFTQIWIGKPDTIGAASYAIWGGETATAGAASEIAPYVSSPDSADLPGYYRFGYSGNGRTNTIGITSGGSTIYHIVSYDASAGTITQYWNSTTANQTSTGFPTSVDRNPFRFEIGGYSNSLNYKGYILECIVMKNVPTPTELSDLDNYITSRY